MRERYTITASKGDDTVVVRVMADCHEQHIWSEDMLVGVSKAGLAKLDTLHDAGYFMRDDTPYSPHVVGWR